MKARHLRLCLTITLSAALLLPSTASAKRTPSKRCERTTSRIEKAKRLAAGRVGAQLKGLQRRDPECVEAARAAFDLMQRSWDKVLPVAVKKVPRAVVLGELRRYSSHVKLAQAIATFKGSGVTAKAHLAIGRLHDAMSQYLEEVGTGPDTIFLIKDPNALYHSRAVDLREQLKIKAEASYATVVRMLKDASSKNETLGEARTRLISLRERYIARQPPPPPPEEPEPEPELAPEGAPEGEGDREE